MKTKNNKIWKNLPINIVRYILNEYKPDLFYKRIYRKSVLNLKNKFSYEYIKYNCNNCNSEYRGKIIDKYRYYNDFIYYVDENTKNNTCTGTYKKKFSMCIVMGKNDKICSYCLPDFMMN